MPRLKLMTATLAASSLFVLAACGGSDQQTDQATADAANSSSSDSSKAEGGTTALKIAESGFGQKDEYVWSTAVVNVGKLKPGSFVVVNFNLYDASGQLVKSGSQTEQTYKTGQALVLGTQIDVPADKKVTKLEATVSSSNDMTPSSTDEVTLGAVSVVSDGYGGTNAKFEISNQTDKPLMTPRIAVVCKDGAGKINGGGSEFPELVPPKGKTMANTYLVTSGKPASCKAYYNGPM